MKQKTSFSSKRPIARKQQLARNPRAIAFDVLRQRCDPAQNARERLEQALRETRLVAKDARLAHELALGALRQLRLLDYQLEPFLENPLDRYPPELLDVLRLGFYQHYFLDKIPPHALVDECVNLAKAHTSRKGGALVNAVLRNLLRQSPPLREPEDPGVRFSQPDWLIKLGRERLGPGEAERFWARSNERPDLHLRVNLLKTTLEEFCTLLAKEGAQIKRSGSPAPESVVVAGALGELERREWFSQGLASVQDGSAQLIAHFCHPRPEERIIDWCAAPGGKSAHLAELTGDRARILALDVDAARLRKVDQTISRLGLQNVETRELHPGLLEYLAAHLADLVLVDAPCTTLGALRRNPDVRWRRSPEDPAKMRRRQLEILQAAAKSVRDGGRLVYSVCTFTREENEEVIETFLRQQPAFALVRQDELPAFLQDLIDSDGFLRAAPSKHDIDAFFAACLHKRQ